jgi:hypothetical protein
MAGVPIVAQKTAFDLSVDLMQPLFSAIRLLLVGFNLGFELGDVLLCGAQLMRKPLRRIDRLAAILFGDICSPVEKL